MYFLQKGNSHMSQYSCAYIFRLIIMKLTLVSLAKFDLNVLLIENQHSVISIRARGVKITFE